MLVLCYHKVFCSGILSFSRSLSFIFNFRTLFFSLKLTVDIWLLVDNRLHFGLCIHSRLCLRSGICLRFGLYLRFGLCYRHKINQIALFADRSYQPFKSQFHKMVKHTQKFVGNLPTKCLSAFDHFVGLALK